LKLDQVSRSLKAIAKAFKTKKRRKILSFLTITIASVVQFSSVFLIRQCMLREL